MCEPFKKDYEWNLYGVGNRINDVLNVVNFVFLASIGMFLMFNKKFHRHPYRIMAASCLAEA